MYFHIYDTSNGEVLQVVMTPEKYFDIAQYKRVLSDDGVVDIDYVKDPRNILGGVIVDGELRVRDDNDQR